MIDATQTGNTVGAGEVIPNQNGSTVNVPSPRMTAATGNLYMQVLRDSGQTNNTLALMGTNAPWLNFSVTIDVAGTYGLSARVAGPNANGNTLYVEVLDSVGQNIGDGLGGSVADWYRVTGADPSYNNFDSGVKTVGGFEKLDYGNGDVPMQWNLSAGSYQIRFIPRADGVALDSFTLALVPEPSSMALLGLGGLLLRRRR